MDIESSFTESKLKKDDVIDLSKRLENGGVICSPTKIEGLYSKSIATIWEENPGIKQIRQVTCRNDIPKQERKYQKKYQMYFNFMLIIRA